MEGAMTAEITQPELQFQFSQTYFAIAPKSSPVELVGRSVAGY